eukprot:jgi/Psemu1/294262/fgenesh1_pm.13_\
MMLPVSYRAFCPVVICPGFGNDSIDYSTPLDQPEEVGLISVLARRGFDPDQIYTVPVQRSDWIRVAGGLLDVPGFYLGTAKPTGPGYGWYVKRLRETVDRAYREQKPQSADGNGNRNAAPQKVLVIGHSAGGWLARAAMADGVWCDTSDSNSNNDNEPSVVRTSDRIRCLVTMGAIHRVPEDASTCVTRGALKYTDENYPGAFLRDEGIAYVSIGGSAIVGDDRKDDEKKDDDTNSATASLQGSAADEYYQKRGEGNSNRVAFSSYKAVSGNGNLIGDGVVPLEWTQLEGSRTIVLPDVLHSINEAGTTFPTDRWYGSEKVIDRWLPAVLEEANLKNNNNNNNNPLDFAVGGLQKWASGLIGN